jgi:mono/diheme cytochrome c family protein
MFKRRIGIVVIPLALVLSACGGTNLSGEPKIVQESEIVSQPTVAPSPTPITDVTTGNAAASDNNNTVSAEATPATSAGGESGVDLTNADYDQGFNLYLSDCAQCHGAQDGTGPSLAKMRDNAATRIDGMAAADYLYQSIVDPGAYVVDGFSNVMPGDFASQLTPQEIGSLVKFILEFDPSSMMGNAEASSSSSSSSSGATPVASSGDTLTVEGKLVQGTADGAPIPAGQLVELYALDAQGNLAGAYDANSSADGTFSIPNVTRAAGDMYLIQVTYDDVPQGVQINPIQGDESTLTQDVTLYERTTDTSDIAISFAQMLINFAPIDDFGLEVWLQLNIVNNSDKIVTSDETAGPNDWYVSATMQLPVGSFGIQPMQSENSARYVVDTVDGVPVVKDTWPLRPGQVHSITVAYYLPYDNGAVIDQSFDYPVIDGAVLVPNDTVDFTSDQFDMTGTWSYRVSHGGVRVTELQPDEQIDPDTDFTLVKMHELLKPVSANGRIIFELAGKPTRTAAVIATTPTLPGASTSSNTNSLPLILAGAGIVAIVLGGVLWWRQRTSAHVPTSSGGTWQPPDPSASKETLLKEITTLDDAYEAGHIDDDIYEERRAILTERLLPLLDEDEGGNEDNS